VSDAAQQRRSEEFTQTHWTQIALAAMEDGSEVARQALERLCTRYWPSLYGYLRRQGRLPAEAEWEYCCRAGTTTPFWWGSSITPAQANYDGNYVYAGGGSKGKYRKGTVPVGDFAANPWGLYNVHGNVWGWCEDVWHDSYNGAPTDASAWLQGGEGSSRVVRGGAWNNNPRNLRSADRNRNQPDNHNRGVGVRVASTLCVGADGITVPPGVQKSVQGRS